MSPKKTRGRVVVALLLVALLLPPGLSAAVGGRDLFVHRPGESSLLQGGKLHPLVDEAVQRGDQVEVLVKLKQQADTGQAARAARQALPETATAYQAKISGRFSVVNVLRDTARQTQGPLLDYLEKERRAGQVAELKSFYIVNMVYTRGALQILRY